MPSYRNGQIPEDLLVVFARGRNATDGDWYHALSPATYARHLALVARAFKRTGRRLQITDGFGAYRPLHAQVIARNLYGNGAALPGTSSHGGFWEGRQTLAMDYGNWGTVYGWGQEAFFEDCRAVGLTPGMIMRSRGYPDEPWHVIDLDPWGPVPAFADVTPFTSEPLLEDDDMLMLNIGGKHLAALGPGIFRHFLPIDPVEKIKNLARIQDDWQQVSFSELPALLVTYGCDQHIWDVRDGKFVVVDPLNGTVKEGNAWTAAKAIRAAVAGIKIPDVDPTPIVDAVKAALADARVTADVDEHAIAVAVADEHARRMQA